MAFTFFFRDLQTLEMIADHVAKDTMGRTNVYGWDAGCATGQEPYSMSIVLAEKLGNFAFRNFKLYATDLDPQDQFCKVIEKAEYNDEETKRIPDDIREKYFENGGSGMLRVSEKIRNSIYFKKIDLLKLEAPRSDFSFVICKNVLLHFSHKERIEVIKMYHNSLLDGGYFAMENTQTMPEELKEYWDVLQANAKIYKKRKLA